MAVSRFELGSVIRLVALFKTPKTAVPPSEYIDPANITLTIRNPDLTVETRTYGVSGIDRTDTGKYAASITLAQEGTYKWRWEAQNGADQAGVKSGTFDSISESDF
jgi:hypothetical protein